MKLRLTTWLLSVSLLLTTLCGGAGADPAVTSVTGVLVDAVQALQSSNIQQYGGDWAGPDLAPYSRERDKGEIVGRPPITKPSVVKPVTVTRPPVTPPPPVSVAPPPTLPQKNVAGAIPIQQLFDNGSLIPSWVGQGRVAGEMVELGLDNRTNQPLAIALQPGMVLALEDEDLAGEFQPVMLESDSTILVPANGSVTKMIRGYCLDYSKLPPTAGRTFPYKFPADTMAWAPAVNILQASLDYDAAKNVLEPDAQKTIIIQRAIWAALDPENDKEKLYDDILADAASAGKTISKKKARRLADTLWGEVERLTKMAE